MKDIFHDDKGRRKKLSLLLLLLIAFSKRTNYNLITL